MCQLFFCCASNPLSPVVFAVIELVSSSSQHLFLVCAAKLAPLSSQEPQPTALLAEDTQSKGRAQNLQEHDLSGDGSLHLLDALFAHIHVHHDVSRSGIRHSLLYSVTVCQGFSCLDTCIYT